MGHSSESLFSGAAHDISKDRAIRSPAHHKPTKNFLGTTSKSSVDPGFSAVKRATTLKASPFGGVFAGF
ncbi:hypothetical protein QO058_04230 [Bosea vestrisii]|uniref:hypothetical protein n=1 Tax=Bosea vestrisii TaxID=151416 RepID=UPI0024DFD58D|nr:hypothetical protein [Bosea vestrisii]WID97483.1 hypothetical protein QO058_04230 [Bosea vestrisii]